MKTAPGTRFARRDAVMEQDPRRPDEEGKQQRQPAEIEDPADPGRLSSESPRLTHEERGTEDESHEDLHIPRLVGEHRLAQVDPPGAGVNDLQHAGKPEPEEEEVDDRDQDGGDLVLPRTDHHRREQLGGRAPQPEAVLDPVGERSRILVGVARGDEEHGYEGQEQVRAQEDGEKLPVGSLVPAHPTDRRALA